RFDRVDQEPQPDLAPGKWERMPRIYDYVIKQRPNQIKQSINSLCHQVSKTARIKSHLRDQYHPRPPHSSVNAHSLSCFSRLHVIGCAAAVIFIATRDDEDGGDSN